MIPIPVEQHIKNRPGNRKRLRNRQCLKLLLQRVDPQSTQVHRPQKTRGMGKLECLILIIWSVI